MPLHFQFFNTDFLFSISNKFQAVAQSLAQIAAAYIEFRYVMVIKVFEFKTFYFHFYLPSSCSTFCVVQVMVGGDQLPWFKFPAEPVLCASSILTR
jgi:hypothetical protein